MSPVSPNPNPNPTSGRGAASGFSGRRAPKSSARSRPRASVACASCRQKKIKCDAQDLEPGQSCSTCRNSQTECVVNKHGDRRKHGSREHITALQGRMETLEALIRSQSQSVLVASGSPSDTSSEYALPQAIPENARLGQTGQAQLDSQHTPVSLSGYNDSELGEIEVVPEVPSLSETEVGVAQPIINDVAAEAVPGNPFNLSMQTIPSDNLGCRPEPQVSKLDDLTPSLDADSSPGKVRYYGPTTQLHIQKYPETDPGVPAGRAGAMMDFTVDMDSPQLRDVLMASYWTYYARSVRFVDENIFMAHRAAGKRSQYYSNFLETSLLACATRTSTSQAVRKLGRSYADRAKKDLVVELEQPTIASLQAFLLLSDFEATSARDRVGWTYSGIACRLLFDLGLHEDCSQLVKHGILVEADANLRNMLFLSAYVYDRLWALYLGRPSCVPLAALQQQRPFAAPNESPNILDHWVSLCKLISEATDMLNSGGFELDYSAVDRLSDLSERISAAHANLPQGLAPDQISELDVNAYGLNMQFCGIKIVLQRALVKILCQSTSDEVNHHRATIEKWRGMMYENAACICRLVLAYREIFGIESFITVMLDNMYIAASTLISHVLRPPASSDPDAGYSESLRLIGVISETMDAIQKHYPVADKMRKTLSTIAENTVLAGSFGPPDGRYEQGRPVMKPPPGTAIPSLTGSWGSMEALVHDDFILGQNNLIVDEFASEGGSGYNLWMPDFGIGPIA